MEILSLLSITQKAGNEENAPSYFEMRGGYFLLPLYFPVHKHMDSLAHSFTQCD